MDLVERGKLDLSAIRMLVLDEADEMLKMGFIDDVEWILEKCPAAKQTALFSATMPDVIKKVAKKNLISPEEIRIAAKTATATTVRQRYWLVSGLKKIDALIRLLEVEPYDALLIFTRTKTDAEELEQKLSASGISCDALHGDIPQKIREKVVDRLRKGQLDVLVATDVVARGLDVDRITHVINYDIPFDPESYVHRIGRTGRAGKTGDAILFVSPRERRMLRLIENVTRSVIEPMKMPTNEDINRHRADRFRDRIISAMEGVSDDEMAPYRDIVKDILESGEEEIDVGVDIVEPTILALAERTIAFGILFETGKHETIGTQGEFGRVEAVGIAVVGKVQVGYGLVLLGNGKAVMDIPVQIDVELVHAIGGKKVGGTDIGFIAQGVDIGVEGLDSHGGGGSVVCHAVLRAGNAVARLGEDGV